MEGRGTGHTHRVEPDLPKLPGPGQAGLQGKGRSLPKLSEPACDAFSPFVLLRCRRRCFSQGCQD